jgi:hypothetical protein
MVCNVELKSLDQQLPMIVSAPELIADRFAKRKVPTSDPPYLFFFHEKQFITNCTKLVNERVTLGTLDRSWRCY